MLILLCNVPPHRGRVAGQIINILQSTQKHLSTVVSPQVDLDVLGPDRVRNVKLQRDIGPSFTVFSKRQDSVTVGVLSEDCQEFTGDPYIVPIALDLKVDRLIRAGAIVGQISTRVCSGVRLL